METFVVAYSLVWLAVFLYVVRLDVRHRRYVAKAGGTRNAVGRTPEALSAAADRRAA